MYNCSAHATSFFSRSAEHYNWHQHLMQVPGQSRAIPIQCWDDFADSLCCTSWCWDDVLSGTSAITPHFSRWSIHSLLGSGVSMDCCLKGGPVISKQSVMEHLSGLPGSHDTYGLMSRGLLTISASTMPKLSLMTFARGARQFVVQDALLWTEEQMSGHVATKWKLEVTFGDCSNMQHRNTITVVYSSQFSRIPLHGYGQVCTRGPSARSYHVTSELQV